MTSINNADTRYEVAHTLQRPLFPWIVSGVITNDTNPYLLRHMHYTWFPLWWQPELDHQTYSLVLHTVTVVVAPRKGPTPTAMPSKGIA